MVTSRRRRGAAGRASERGPGPERRTVGPRRRRSGAGCRRKRLRFRGVVLPRGRAAGGKGRNGVGASAVLEAANPVNPGALGSERRLRGLRA